MQCKPLLKPVQLSLCQLRASQMCQNACLQLPMSWLGAKACTSLAVPHSISVPASTGMLVLGSAGRRWQESILGERFCVEQGTMGANQAQEKGRFIKADLCHILALLPACPTLHWASWICTSCIASVDLGHPIGMAGTLSKVRGNIFPCPEKTSSHFLTCTEYSAGHVAWLSH